MFILTKKTRIVVKLDNMFSHVAEMAPTKVVYVD
jgi:hypothetical protein